MKKTAILFALLALLFTGCSDLFESLAGAAKTGNDNVSNVPGNGLDAGLVVEAPWNPSRPGNLITFDKDTYTYNVTMGTKDSPARITCHPEDPNAHVVYTAYLIEDENGNIIEPPQQLPVTTEGGGGLVTYPYGKTKVIATIVADDPTYTTSYEVILERTRDAGPNGHSLLGDMTLTPGNNSGLETLMTVSPAFTPENTSYRADVDEDADTLTVDVSAFDNADISYVVKDKDGNVIQTLSGNPLVVDPLNGGYTEVIITVAENGQPSRDYVLNIYKPGDDFTNLKEISFIPSSGLANGIGTLSPPLSISTQAGGSYSVNVSSDDATHREGFTLNAVPRHKYANITNYSINNGAAITPEGVISGLQDGTTTVTIEVTAKDGVTVNTHTLNIIKAPDTSSELSGITVRTGATSGTTTHLDLHNTAVGVPLANQNFSAPQNAGSYNKIDTNDNYAEIVLTAFDKDCVIAVTDVVNNAINPAAPNFTLATPPRTFHTSNLPDGETVVTFTVTPESGAPVRTFTVTLIKPDEDDALIKAMTLTPDNGTAVMVPPRPEPQPAVTTVYVDPDTDTLTFGPNFMHSGASIQTTPVAVHTLDVNGGPVGTPQHPSSSGTNPFTIGSAAQPLPAGTSQVTFDVTAEDGTTKTYVINIVKPALNENRLRSFTVNGTNFTGFDRDTFNYTDTMVRPASLVFGAEAIYNDATVELSVTPPGGGSPVSQSGTGSASVPIAEPAGGYVIGNYVVTATVTHNGNSRTYTGTLTLTYPDISTLHTLTVTHGSSRTLSASPAFAADDETTTNYSYSGMTVNRNYNTPIRVQMSLTDADATINPVTASSNPAGVTSSWDAGSNTLTIENYSNVNTISIPVTVVSQAGNNTTYNLSIAIPQLSAPITGTASTTLPGPFNGHQYRRGNQGANGIAYSYGSEKGKGVPGPEDSNLDLGGIDIIGSSNNGTSWINSSFNGTDVPAAKLGGWHIKVAADSVNEWIDIPQNYTAGNALAVGTTSLEYSMNASIQFSEGVPYVTLTHSITNNGAAAAQNVRIGACSDSEVDDDGGVKFVKTFYGARMTSGTSTAGLYFREGQGVTPVDTFYIGAFGTEHTNIFTDNTLNSLPGELMGALDTAAAYSWTIGELAAGATETRSVRFSVGTYKEADETVE